MTGEDMEERIYRVRDWDKHFEKAQTRRCGRMTWIAVPNKHDGKSYRRIMRHDRQAELLAAWVLILQVASKCDPRGVLIDDGRPLDAEDLADATGLHAEAFELAFDVLTQDRIGWLEVVPSSQHAPSTVGAR